MDDRNIMNELLKIICGELELIVNKGSLDVASLNNLNTLIDIRKDIVEIQAMEEYGYNNYSGYYSSAITDKWNNYNKGYEIKGSSRNYSLMNGNGYNNSSNDYEMINYLKTMANQSSPHKQEMIYQFINQLENTK